MNSVFNKKYFLQLFDIIGQSLSIIIYLTQVTYASHELQLLTNDIYILSLTTL